MLAPTPNKTPLELGIQQWEYDGLIMTMKLLLDGKIPQAFPGELIDTPGRYFNMSCGFQHIGCGTVACIGGWVWILSGHPEEGALSYLTKGTRPMGLHQLYYPRDLAWSKITPTKAADSIQHYLRTGKPLWYREIYDYGNV